eukprot:Ihof_evm9s54 gene=Ihof_evmTU9s54
MSDNEVIEGEMTPMVEEAVTVVAKNEPKFSDFGLDDCILRAISKLGWTKPTLIQEKGIPLALAGKDVLARARTGSGKTATYALPIIQKILYAKHNLVKTRGVRGLIMVPTKELCDQALRHVRELTAYCSKQVKVVAISSNVDLATQKPALLDKPDILIATPSRVLAHLRSKNLTLELVEMMVIDEADLLFSFGYEEDLRSLLGFMPSIFQSFVMSATMTKDVDALKTLVLRNPAVLKLEESNLPEDSCLAQYVVMCEETDRLLILYALLAFKLIHGKIIIFVNGIDACYRVKLFLDHFCINACVLNSELPHNSRHHIVSEFNRGTYDIIIASDENTELADEESDGEDELEVRQAGVTVEVSIESEEKENENGGEEENEEEEEDNEEEEEEDEVTGDAEELKKNLDVAAANVVKEDNKRKKKKPIGQQDSEYGMTRGVDFLDVDWVVNVDFPSHTNAYIHRVGRTARAGKHGNALSFVTQPEHKELMAKIEKKLSVNSERKEGGEPILKPYKFSTKKVEGLRYRVEEAKRTLGKGAIKKARLKEIRQEILNSQKLKAHFEDNPRDLQVLRHNQQLDTRRYNPSLSHIPSYLMPSKAELSAEREALTNVAAPVKAFSHAENLKKRQAERPSLYHKAKKAKSDPLKSFSVSRSRSNQK